MPVLESVSVADESQEEIIIDGKAKYPLRASLFPRVPPTMRFFAPADEKEVIPLPAGVRNHLKWKLTSITPAIVRETVRRSGFRITTDENKWCAMWGKHMKFAFFAGMNPFQKVNHFPGSFHLGRKDKLHLNLSRLKKNSSIDLDFVPQTFLLPQEAKPFQKAWKKEGAQNHRWIAKPPAASRGTGVFIVSRWSQISHKLQEALVVQRYIHRPLLIRGNKFDLRLYALVTGWEPLKIYVYKQGMLRFATMAYSESVDSLDNTFMHLTNYSLNKLSAEYSDEQKWTLDEFWAHLKVTMPHVDKAQVWSSLVNVIVKTLIAAEGPISRASSAHAPSRYSCFELFGFDVLLDAELRPWLLEVNISPSMRASSTNDHAIKEPLIRDTLNLSGFRLPPAADGARIDPTDYGLRRDDSLVMSAAFHRKHLTVAEKQKRELFTCDEFEFRDSAILEKLLPHDVTMLADLEDELERSHETNFERVVPSADFEHLVPQRYANRLLNAWENRYSENRSKGLALLQELCRNGAHIAPSEDEGEKLSSLVDKKPTPAPALWRNSFAAKVRSGAAVRSRTAPRAISGFNRLMKVVTNPPLRQARRFNSSDSFTSQDSTPNGDTLGALCHDSAPTAAIDSTSQSSTGSMLDDNIALDSSGSDSDDAYPLTPHHENLKCAKYSSDGLDTATLGGVEGHQMQTLSEIGISHEPGTKTNKISTDSHSRFSSVTHCEHDRDRKRYESHSDSVIARAVDAVELRDR